MSNTTTLKYANKTEEPNTIMMLNEPTGSNRRIFEPPLSIQRYKWVQSYIDNDPNIKRVTDFGCGNGRIMNWLKAISHLELINFVDIDFAMLDYELNNAFRPGLCEMLFGRQNSDKSLNIKVYNGDLSVPDDRLAADCFIMIEVIEHMMPQDVELAMRTLFGYYKPNLVIITTPNSEFNHLLRQEGEPAGKFRHFDHKFEWTRAQFKQWSQEICNQYSYSLHFDGVGHLTNSESFGPCTQIAVFRRATDYRLDVKDPVSIDLLMDKLNVDENIPDCKVNRKNMSLLTEYHVPGAVTIIRSNFADSLEFDWNDIAAD